MQRDELSLEAYGLLVKGRKISSFLEMDLDALLQRSSCEDRYLATAGQLVREIREDQERYLDDWLLAERFEDMQLIELLRYIKTVEQIPSTNRIYATQSWEEELPDE